MGPTGLLPPFPWARPHCPRHSLLQEVSGVAKIGGVDCVMVQELTSRYLEQLSSGTTLSLAAFRPASKSGAAEIERITKVKTAVVEYLKVLS